MLKPATYSGFDEKELDRRVRDADLQLHLLSQLNGAQCSAAGPCGTEYDNQIDRIKEFWGRLDNQTVRSRPGAAKGNWYPEYHQWTTNQIMAPTFSLLAQGPNTDLGESCDEGPFNPSDPTAFPGLTRETAGCDRDCTPCICGDGLRNVLCGEECDDGNTAPGDGCSELCNCEGGVCP